MTTDGRPPESPTARPIPPGVRRETLPGAYRPSALTPVPLDAPAPDYTAPGVGETHVFIEVRRNRDPEKFVSDQALGWLGELEALKDQVEDPEWKRLILKDLLQYWSMVSHREVELEKFNVQEDTKRINARVRASRPEKESHELHLHQHDHDHTHLPDFSKIPTEDLNQLARAFLGKIEQEPPLPPDPADDYEVIETQGRRMDEGP